VQNEERDSDKSQHDNATVLTLALRPNTSSPTVARDYTPLLSIEGHFFRVI
jgi:hypothetical protein